MKALKTLLAICVLTMTSAIGHAGDEQAITRLGGRDSIKGSGTFTGTVRIDMQFFASDGIPASGGVVTFEPGARSYWHIHPAGQQIIVLSGVGRTGTWDGKVEEIRPGDVVTCPPNVKHWHGASPNIAMTHLTITGEKDGKGVEWMEAVTDEQYNK